MKTNLSRYWTMKEKKRWTWEIKPRKEIYWFKEWDSSACSEVKGKNVMERDDGRTRLDSLSLHVES